MSKPQIVIVEDCCANMRSFAEAAKALGESMEQFKYLVTPEMAAKLIEHGMREDDFIISETMPDVSLVGGRGSNKSASFEMLMQVKQVQKQTLDGRSRKGDRIRKRKQWRQRC